ncbi:MAG: phosphatidate cytidylyltransferase [Clostridia bacterium]|nr:phosphatidate cytidylyltransferase [Clostridia bacterium]
MKQRIITGLLGVIALIAILMLGEVAVSIAVLAVILMAMYELMSSVEVRKEKALCIINLIFAMLFYGIMLYKPEYTYLMLYLYAITILSSMVFSNGRIKFSLVALACVSMIYVLFMLVHIPLISKLRFGIFYVILILFGAIATDTFAYFTGVTIGKHKLCPVMSPKKTVEGAIGGIIGAVAVFVIYGIILNRYAGVNVNYALLCVLAFLCALVSEIGDLIASVIKRQFGIKDFGNLLPGHGGIMDRVDSISVVAPLVFYFITEFPVFF